MKRVLGMVLAGLVGAGTLFSGAGIAYAEEDSTEEIVTEVSEEQTQESTEANEESSISEEVESSPDSTVEDSFDSSEPVKKLEEESIDSNAEAGYHSSNNDGLESAEIEQVEYSEKVLSSYGGGDGENSSYPPPAKNGVTRYTVLVIDDSGSMGGEPGEKTIAAAKRFCDQYFISDGTNYLAIVAFGDTASTKQAFTTSKDEAYTAIDTFNFDYGTNTNSGLTEAYSLTESIPNSNQIIKNIVILSDGLPEEGDWDDSGEFTEQDSYWSYGYANAAVKTAKTMFNDYNIYSLGFFHSLDGDDLDYARRVMKALQNDGYYEVTDVNDLEFTFGEIAEDVTKNEDYPIIIVPGVLASRLYNRSGDLIWQPDFNNKVEAIKKLWNLSINHKLYTRNNTLNNAEVNSENREYGDGDQFKPLIDYLCDRYSHVYLFSYDWRNSCTDAANELNKEIELVKKRSGSSKVNIVAHSMGGLVTSYYVKKNGCENVNKIVTCGTPYEGSPLLLYESMVSKALLEANDSTKGLTGWDDTIHWIFGGLYLTSFCNIDPTVRSKFPGLAELAPTKEYYEDKSTFGAWNWIDNSGIRTEIRELSSNFINTAKTYATFGNFHYYDTQPMSYNSFFDVCSSFFGKNFQKAKDFHDYIKTASGYNVLVDLDNTYFIVGRGKSTPISGSMYGGDSIIKDLYYADGDEAVPFSSATMRGKLLELSKDRVKLLNVDHGGTNSDPKALNYIDKVLSGDSLNGIEDDKLVKGKKVQIVIRCPVDVTIERSEEILSSEKIKTYSSFGRLDYIGENGEIKSLCLNDDGYNYKVNLNGTDTGTMDLLLRWYDEDSNVVTEKTFYEIPITEKTLMNFSLQEDGTSELYVDNDGDGTVDDTWYSAVGDVGYRIIEEGGETENGNNEGNKEENNEATENKIETQDPVTERKESGSTAQPVNVVKKAASTAIATKATTTGDSNYTALWISLTAAAVATAIAAGVVYTRKRKSE